MSNLNTNVENEAVNQAVNLTATVIWRAGSLLEYGLEHGPRDTDLLLDTINRESGVTKRDLRRIMAKLVETREETGRAFWWSPIYGHAVVEKDEEFRLLDFNGDDDEDTLWGEGLTRHDLYEVMAEGKIRGKFPEDSQVYVYSGEIVASWPLGDLPAEWMKLDEGGHVSVASWKYAIEYDEERGDVLFVVIPR